MKNKTLIRLLVATALLILAVPAVGSAQLYNRGRVNDRARYDRDNRREDRRELRDALARLDNASARLETDVAATRGRRVPDGLLWVGNRDNNAVVEIRDFRRAVRQLRNASDGGRDLRGSYDEVRVVLDRGVRLDRYLRLRTGSTDVDADLSQIRSSLHLIADAYDMRVPY